MPCEQPSDWPRASGAITESPKKGQKGRAMGSWAFAGLSRRFWAIPANPGNQYSREPAMFTLVVKGRSLVTYETNEPTSRSVEGVRCGWCPPVPLIAIINSSVGAFPLFSASPQHVRLLSLSRGIRYPEDDMEMRCR